MLKSRLAGLYDRVLSRLPASLGSRLDRCRPSLLNSWGGPLNGQRERQKIVREVSHGVDFDRLVETGTFRGTSTEFFAAVFGTRIDTVEVDRRNYLYSLARLAHYPNVHVHHGNSVSFLEALATGRDRPDETVFFYLDAHWGEYLPLEEELSVISSNWSRFVVMIDDFEVVGDPGYGFDDYGPGKALTLDYLPELSDCHMFYPSATSASESGMRRGTLVVASGELAPALRMLDSLTPAA